MGAKAPKTAPARAPKAPRATTKSKPSSTTKTKPSSTTKTKPSGAKPKSTSTQAKRTSARANTPPPQSLMSTLRGKLPDASQLRRYGMYGLGAYGGYKGLDAILGWLMPRQEAARTATARTGGATDPSSTVTPDPRNPPPDNAQPSPQGGTSPMTGGNEIKPEQVKENAKNYPNTSGYPWGVRRGGQYIDASGRTPIDEYPNEIAAEQARYFNQRGMATAFQNDLDINAQLTDRGSNLYNAIDRMRGGQLTLFRLGAEEANARHQNMVRTQELNTQLRIAEAAKRQAEYEAELRRRYEGR